jgi:acyl carrier protein
MESRPIVPTEPSLTPMEQTIRDYIVESYLAGGEGASLGLDDDLLAILDSLQVLRMLLDLEARYSIDVDNSELTPDNLGTVRSLAGFIARKRQESIC